MTAADLLTRMTVFDNELEVTSGGDDEARALLALQMAQEYYEAIAANQSGITNGSTLVSTVGGTVSTAWPSTLHRLDSIYYADGSGEVTLSDESGAHLIGLWSPFLLATPGSTTGKPRQFWYTQDESLFWIPTPDAVYSLRVFGFFAKAELTTRAVTFGHPNLVAGPLASFAVKLLEMGIDDPHEDADMLAEKWFLPVIRLMRKRARGGGGRRYQQVHTT